MILSEKKCCRCKKVKLAVDFPSRKIPSGLASWCHQCHRDHHQENKDSRNARSRAYVQNNYEHIMLISARSRARKKCLPCTITETDIFIPQNCPVCNCLLQPGKPGNPTSPSLDMWNPTGYTQGNVWVICYRCNRSKNNIPGDELLTWAMNLVTAFKEHCA